MTSHYILTAYTQPAKASPSVVHHRHCLFKISMAENLNGNSYPHPQFETSTRRYPPCYYPCADKMVRIIRCMKLCGITDTIFDQFKFIMFFMEGCLHVETMDQIITLSHSGRHDHRNYIDQRNSDFEAFFGKCRYEPGDETVVVPETKYVYRTGAMIFKYDKRFQS